MESDKILSFWEVVEIYGVGSASITKAVKDGKLPQYRMEGLRYNRGYKKSEVEHWIAGLEPVPFKKKKLQVKIKLLHPSAVIPSKATPGSFGYDVTATSRAEPIKDFFEVPMESRIYNGMIATHGVYRPGFFFGQVLYGLGFALEIPLGEGAWLLPRSSIKKHNMILANSPGMFDSDYRDEAQACFYFNNTSTLYEPGERIAQFVFLPDPDVEFVVVDKLTPTERKGGFGSTGR